MKAMEMTVIKANNMPGKSRKEMLQERLRGKYPDKEFADDESMYGQINDDYEEYDNTLNGYKERERKLTEMFTQDPRSAQFITDMARGNDPWVAMVERIGIDGMTDLINDPTKKEAYAEAHKKYLERVAKERALKEEYSSNLQQSLALFDEMKQTEGVTDDQIDAAADLINNIAHEAIMGKFTKETMNMALKALNYDTAVQSAGAEGEVRGRNAKIEERLMQPQQGDGQPVLAGANNMPARRPSEGSILELASQA